MRSVFAVLFAALLLSASSAVAQDEGPLHAAIARAFTTDLPRTGSGAQSPAPAVSIPPSAAPVTAAPATAPPASSPTPSAATQAAVDQRIRTLQSQLGITEAQIFMVATYIYAVSHGQAKP